MRLHRLDLRFELEDPDRPDYPVVTILIDGDDRFANAGGSKFIGFDPRDVLGPDSPLHPLDFLPRRVAVYRCNCGEPGCGVVAPIITEGNGRITWSDFRDYTGVFASPDVDDCVTDEALEDGKLLHLDDISFDSEQYRAEVERASADQSWETERRKTARLLREYLESEVGILLRAGYRLSWASLEANDPSAYHVSLWKRDLQIVVEVRSSAGSPEERATAMAEQLLLTDPGKWNVVFKSRPLVML